MKSTVLNLTTFSDESGQDSQGKIFVVCTLVIPSQLVEELERTLLEIETESGKTQKWTATGNMRKHKYAKLLISNKIFNKTDVYYSEFSNKSDYITLIGSHLAKSILYHVGEQQYITKIYIDKMNKRALEGIKQEIKLYHIRYKKIVGLRDEASACIRLVDTICGIIRDINHINVDDNCHTAPLYC